jgi:NAD(P)-dependent dehydrogenase (short-subunit alcohol dehydrogenase family)
VPRLRRNAHAGAERGNIVGKTGRSAEEARHRLAATNPLGRFVRPEEVAAAVLWLCGPGSDAVTGQAISVSGGETW